MDFLGYLGDRDKRRVFGRWKETVVRTFRLVVGWAPTRAAFLAFLAFVSFEGVLAGSKVNIGLSTLGRRSHWLSFPCWILRWPFGCSLESCRIFMRKRVLRVRNEVGESEEMHVHPNASIAIHRQNRPTSSHQLLIQYLRREFSHLKV